MKHIRTLLLASLLLLGSSAFAVSYHTVPLGHRVYTILDVAEYRGLIEKQMDVKPYSVDTVLRLAFAFGLDADAAQELLEIAQASRLQPRVERDAVIAFCLHHHLSLMDAQQMLYDRGLPLMGSRTGR